MRVDDGPEQKSTAFGKAGTLQPWLANFSFWVAHPESSSVTVRALDGGRQLGAAAVSLTSAVWDRSSKKDLPPPTWLDLSDGAGRVRAQLFVIKAPPAGAPHDLKVLVGTWNVGNEPPPADLTSWLQCGQGRPKGGSRTPSRRNSENELSKAAGELPDAPKDPSAESNEDPSDEAKPKLPPVAPPAPMGADSDTDSETEADTPAKDKKKKKKKEKTIPPPPPVPETETGLNPKKFGNYDMVVVGCQEGDYDPREGFDKCDDDWTACLANTLGDSYVLHCKNALGQMRLCVFVRADVAPAVHHWLKSTEATGLGHIMNNKGGVGVSCRVWDTSVCFINSHLAAHDDMHKRRDDDFAEIVGGCKFGEKLECTEAFHHLVWMGDLNYRCEWGIEPGAEIKRKPTTERFNAMMAKVKSGPPGRAEIFAKDQLTRSRKAGDAFMGFSEGDPAASHMPTFKVQRELGFNYKTQRTPAWCDRVLWKTAEGFKAAQTLLAAAGDVGTSDHKPVAAGLTLELLAHSATVHIESDGPDQPASPMSPVEGVSSFDVALDVAPSTAAPTQVEKSPSAVRRTQTIDATKSTTVQDQSLLTKLFKNLCCCLVPSVTWSPPTSQWILRFEELSATNLIAADMNGLSDPYVVFFASVLEDPAKYVNLKGGNPKWRTKTINADLNPVWPCDGKAVPTLPLAVSRADVIGREHLLIRVMDRDTLSNDDLIGSARLYLGDFGDAIKEERSGKIEKLIQLTNKGRRAGEMMLSLVLEKNPNYAA